MHPYWAVERLTQEELLKRNADAKEGPVEINMETKFVKLHTVAVAPCGNMTIDIEMQVMTNSKQVKKGARLVVAGAKKVEPKKRRLTGETTKRQRPPRKPSQRQRKVANLYKVGSDLLAQLSSEAR